MNTYSHRFYLKGGELLRNVDVFSRLHYGGNALCFAISKKDACSAIQWDDKALYNRGSELAEITIYVIFTNQPAEQDFLRRIPKSLLHYYYAIELRNQLTSNWFIWYDVFDINGRKVHVDYDNGPDYSSIGCDDGE